MRIMDINVTVCKFLETMVIGTDISRKTDSESGSLCHVCLSWIFCDETIEDKFESDKYNILVLDLRSRESSQRLRFHQSGVISVGNLGILRLTLKQARTGYRGPS